MPQPLRLGLVGAGPWGRNYIRTAAGLAELRLARVSSRNPRTRSLVPDDCDVSTDWRDVACGPDLDAIVVASPPASHAEIVLAAIEIGRPVLVEKPLALDAAAAERIVARAAERQVLVMVDHVHLFHPDYRALKRRLAGRKVSEIRAQAGDRGPYRRDVSVLWDWGPHDVAMCIDLVGVEPESATAETVERGSVGERLRISLGFPGSVPATIELSTLDDRHRSFAVRLGSEVLHYDGAPPPDPHDLPLTRALAEFAECVRTGDVSLESVRLGAAVVRTLARCDAALARARPQ